ncbi:MAG: restriction endonuclease subunit S [Bacteroidales bacterium]|nr:restriction endonuclease subunit S [Bacteroidales bacterium]
MKQYSKYKNSGIDWLGNIPEHWEVKRVKDCFKSIGSGSTPKSSMESLYDDEGYYWIQSGDLNDGYVSDTKTKINDAALERTPALRLYPKNSLIVAMYGATIGKLGMTTIDAYTNQACCVMSEPSNLNTRFLFYEFSFFKPTMLSFATGGGQPNISQEDIKLHLFPLPPFSEQTSIAAYLDEKTANIDRRIELLRNKIDNYKQLRRSLISQVVTRGLNPDVKLKNSGIEWLGDVPEHWEVKRVKDVVSSNQDAIKMGPFGSSLTDRVNYDGKYKVYGQWNVVGNDFFAGKNYVDEKGYKELINFQVKPGEILISMMGTIGKCATIPNNIQSGIMDSHIIKISLNKKIIHNRFFEYVYDKDNSNIVKHQLDKIKRGSIMDGLNSSIVKILSIPLPPITEQTAIAAYLDDKTAQIDSIIGKCEKQIEQLSELRRSLIAQAVTGQIKVC